MADQKKIGLSFGFSKKAEVIKLKESVINEEIREREDKDYLISLEDRKINSLKPVEEKAPLVIELIQNNRWRHAQRPEDLECSTTDDKVERRVRAIECVKQTGDEVVDAAVSEIIADAARLNEKTLSGTIDSSLAIPLLMQNKVPDGFETDERLNVDLRPNEATGEDYEKVPIEQFGLAMLRGMGWKDGEGIGMNKKIVKALDPVVRPKGLGLGADKSAVLQSKDKTGSSALDEAVEALVLKTGAYCQVVSGKRDGQFGTVSGIDCENSRVLVSMTVDSEVISLSQFAVKLVTKKEYDKYSKYLNKSKVDQYQDERRKHEERSSRKADSETRTQHTKLSSSTRQDKPSVEENDRRGTKRSDYSDAKSKKRDGSRRDTDDFENRGSKPDTDRKRKHQDEQSSEEHQKQSRDSWLRTHLRVRVVDKSYRKGKYYKCKVTVVDVLGGEACVCRTEDGHVLDDLLQSQLETVIPNQTSSSTYVMIVNGKYRSQLGQLMERDRERCRVVVQLLSDRDVALTMEFNDICEYAADIAVDDFDY